MKKREIKLKITWKIVISNCGTYCEYWSTKMRINKKYIILFFVLLAIEILIALFVHDRFIRPYIGDVLVVILMYTFIRGIISRNIKFLPVYLFLVSVFVEVMQYYKIMEILNPQNNKVISIIFGTSFDLKDILCYLLGSIILIIWESRTYLKKWFKV